MSAADTRYEVSFTERALEDARELKQYLAERLGNPEASRRAMGQIVGAAESLATFPLRNRVVA